MGLITPSKSRVLPFLFGVSLASVLFGGAAYYHQVQSALGMEKASAGDATTNWGRCEDRGWTTIKDEATCRLAATLNKGSYDNDHVSSRYPDIVDGCSTRGGKEILFFNSKGTCDPEHNPHFWAFAGCDCSQHNECLCLT